MRCYPPTAHLCRASHAAPRSRATSGRATGFAAVSATAPASEAARPAGAQPWRALRPAPAMLGPARMKPCRPRSRQTSCRSVGWCGAEHSYGGRRGEHVRRQKVLLIDCEVVRRLHRRRVFCVLLHRTAHMRERAEALRCGDCSCRGGMSHRSAKTAKPGHSKGPMAGLN